MAFGLPVRSQVRAGVLMGPSGSTNERPGTAMVRFGGRPSCPAVRGGGTPASGSDSRRMSNSGHAASSSTGRAARIVARRLARGALLVLLATGFFLGADARATVRNSLLLLIDTSGSMDNEIGNGNPEIKIEAAKDAAIAAVDRALASGATEVAVLGFSGDCASPISERLDFTTDGDEMTRFIRGLQAVRRWRTPWWWPIGSCRVAGRPVPTRR